MKELKLPDTGMGISEGTIVKWRKAVGDRISLGEIVLDVETAKATVEVEAPDSGIIEKILFAEGDTIEVETVIALFREEDQA